MIGNPLSFTDIDIPLYDLSLIIKHSGYDIMYSFWIILQPNIALICNPKSMSTICFPQRITQCINAVCRNIACKIITLNKSGFKLTLGYSAPIRAVSEFTFHGINPLKTMYLQLTIFNRQSQKRFFKDKLLRKQRGTGSLI
ncbi:hypothetical protein D3C79_923370 [compost metagenome]